MEEEIFVMDLIDDINKNLSNLNDAKGLKNLFNK